MLNLTWSSVTLFPGSGFFLPTEAGQRETLGTRLSQQQGILNVGGTRSCMYDKGKKIKINKYYMDC